MEIKSGVVYPGETVDIGRKVMILKNMARGLRWLGGVMIGYGLIAGGMILGPVVKAEYSYLTQKSKVKIQNYNSKVKNERQVLPVDRTVPDENYSIYIPEIGAISRVIPNVDAGDQKEYLAALKLGVAEAAGLAHPGQKGTTFLFAHSAAPVDFARYNAVFYLLDRLEEGDEIEIVYKDKLYEYLVSGKEILEARNTKYLVNQNKELLILQTCWPPGTTWKRLVLTAEPVMVY